MHTGAFRKNRIAVIIVALCLCIVAGAAGGTYAYLTANTDTLSNTLVPAKVSCTVEEDFANGVKENVCVRNTGNIDAYIRAVVVTTFVSENGKVLATAPRENVDYTVAWAASGWTKGTDGYWYYTKAIAPDGLTEPLIETATVITAPDGYRLNMQIIATAIQSNPATAVEAAWNVTVSNGEIVPN